MLNVPSHIYQETSGKGSALSNVTKEKGLAVGQSVLKWKMKWRAQGRIY